MVDAVLYLGDDGHWHKRALPHFGIDYSMGVVTSEQTTMRLGARKSKLGVRQGKVTTQHGSRSPKLLALVERARIALLIYISLAPPDS